MRILLTCLFSIICMAGDAQEPPRQPSADMLLSAAYARATAGNKHVLLIFHASWCGWCKRLDASLQDSSVNPLVDPYFEIVHLSVYEPVHKRHLENPGSLELITRLGGAGIGLPFWYVLDAAGQVLFDAQYAPGKNTGCPATEVEVAYFVKVLEQTTPLTPAQLEIIRTRFRKNNSN